MLLDRWRLHGLGRFLRTSFTTSSSDHSFVGKKSDRLRSARRSSTSQNLLKLFCFWLSKFSCLEIVWRKLKNVSPVVLNTWVILWNVSATSPPGWTCQCSLARYCRRKSLRFFEITEAPKVISRSGFNVFFYRVAALTEENVGMVHHFRNSETVWNYIADDWNIVNSEESR